VIFSIEVEKSFFTLQVGHSHKFDWRARSINCRLIEASENRPQKTSMRAMGDRGFDLFVYGFWCLATAMQTGGQRGTTKIILFSKSA
jgi:hypothetical protein